MLDFGNGHSIWLPSGDISLAVDKWILVLKLILREALCAVDYVNAETHNQSRIENVCGAVIYQGTLVSPPVSTRLRDNHYRGEHKAEMAED